MSAYVTIRVLNERNFSFKLTMNPKINRLNVSPSDLDLVSCCSLVVVKQVKDFDWQNDGTKANEFGLIVAY